GTSNAATPVTVAGLGGDVADIAAGGGHTCARRSSGQVVCWGSNAFGQLGDGGTTSPLARVPVVGLDDAAEISAGGSHTCASRATGELVCWGAGLSGQLGDGTNTDSPSPVAVRVDSVLVVPPPVIGGGIYHSCVIRDGGQVFCWGANMNGQLGD